MYRNNNEVEEQPPTGVGRPISTQNRFSFFKVQILGLVVLTLFASTCEGGIMDAKLKEIRALSDSAQVSPWVQRARKEGALQEPEICLDDGCLDAGTIVFWSLS